MIWYWEGNDLHPPAIWDDDTSKWSSTGPYRVQSNDIKCINLYIYIYIIIYMYIYICILFLYPKESVGFLSKTWWFPFFGCLSHGWLVGWSNSKVARNPRVNHWLITVSFVLNDDKMIYFWKQWGIHNLMSSINSREIKRFSSIIAK